MDGVAARLCCCRLHYLQYYGMPERGNGRFPCHGYRPAGWHGDVPSHRWLAPGLAGSLPFAAVNSSQGSRCFCRRALQLCHCSLAAVPCPSSFPSFVCGKAKCCSFSALLCSALQEALLPNGNPGSDFSMAYYRQSHLPHQRQMTERPTVWWQPEAAELVFHKPVGRITSGPKLCERIDAQPAAAPRLSLREQYELRRTTNFTSVDFVEHMAKMGLGREISHLRTRVKDLGDALATKVQRQASNANINSSSSNGNSNGSSIWRPVASATSGGDSSLYRADTDMPRRTAAAVRQDAKTRANHEYRLETTDGRRSPFLTTRHLDSGEFLLSMSLAPGSAAAAIRHSDDNRALSASPDRRGRFLHDDAAVAGHREYTGTELAACNSGMEYKSKAAAYRDVSRSLLFTAATETAAAAARTSTMSISPAASPAKRTPAAAHIMATGSPLAAFGRASSGMTNALGMRSISPF